MSRRFTALGMALGVLLPALVVTAAHAETVSIAPDNTWHAFDVDDLQSLSGGLEWISNADGSALEFTFTTLASSARHTAAAMARRGVSVKRSPSRR